MESSRNREAEQKVSHSAVPRRNLGEELHRDLLYMRKDAGFTALRITRAPHLTRLLGGSSEPFEALRERLISAIQSLRDPQPQLLLDVFGLSPETEGTPLLKDRRAHYGRKAGVKVEAVADRETAALHSLRTQLVTGWYPKSPMGFRVPEYHNGFVQESVQIVTTVKNRRWQETREHYQLIAAFDEADYISISSSFPGQPLVEGDFTVQTERIGESFTHQFWHKEPMRRGNVYDLHFRLVPALGLGNPGALTEESRAFHEPTRLVRFEAVFIGEAPAVIWSYKALSYFERPGEPQAGQQLQPNSGGSVRADFQDLYGGLHSGIAWRWDEA